MTPELIRVREGLARKPSQERKENGKKVNIISPYYKYDLCDLKQKQKI